jgi:hypothetical protein
MDQAVTVMAILDFASSETTDPIELAAQSLVRLARIGDKRVVTLPLYYPSGAAAAIEVGAEGESFRVSDGGLAFQETELIGGESQFARKAEAIAKKFGIEADRRIVFCHARADQLAGAIADVGAASVQIAQIISDELN